MFESCDTARTYSLDSRCRLAQTWRAAGSSSGLGASWDRVSVGAIVLLKKRQALSHSQGMWSRRESRWPPSFVRLLVVSSRGYVTCDTSAVRLYCTHNGHAEGLSHKDRIAGAFVLAVLVTTINATLSLAVSSSHMLRCGLPRGGWWAGSTSAPRPMLCPSRQARSERVTESSNPARKRLAQCDL